MRPRAACGGSSFDWRNLLWPAAPALAAGFLLALAGPGGAQVGDPVVVRVNGVEIRAGDLKIAEEEFPPALQQLPPETKRDYVANLLIDRTLAAEAADARKLADSEDVQRRFAYARNRVLRTSMLQAETKAALTDEAAQSAYADIAKEMRREKEVRARHILVDTEDEAKEIVAALRQGGDFAALAQRSKEEGGPKRAGDLGYFAEGDTLPVFWAAAFALQPGQISDPVKTEFGWHVIKVEDKRDRVAPPFAQLKRKIEADITRKAQEDLIARLRAGARIEIAPLPAAGEPSKP